MNAPVAGTRTPIFELLRSRQEAQPLPAAPVAEPEAADLIDFTRMFGTLWRGRLRLCAVTLLAAALGTVWAAFVAVPQYRATAVLIMAPETVAPTTLAGVVPGLSGDSVAVNTEVEILKSRALMRTLAEELALDTDPEFNTDLAPPSPLDAALGRVAARFGVAGGEAGGVAAAAALSRTVDTLQDRIAVRSVPDSRVFEVTAESRDPAKAADLANALARIYLGEQIALKQQEAAQATDWLSDRVAELAVELEAADSRARRFAAEMDLVTPEALEALAMQLNEIRRRITARQADLARNGAPPARVRTQIEPMRAMEAELARQLSRHSQALVALGQLQLEAEASRAIYEHFLGRLKDAAVQRGIQKSDSRILSAAEVPVLPSWPQPLLIGVLCGFLGAVAAVAWLLSREARQRVFRTVHDLETGLRRPVHGVLPRIAARDAATAARRIVARPGSFAAESARGLRTSLFVGPDNPPQVILVTSSTTGEGRAELAGALGQSLADLKRNVLVVEADIRRRGKDRLRSRAARPGLVAVLEGRSPLRKAVRRPRGVGFDLLAVEAPRATAADLLSSRQIETLIKTARQQYDTILVLSPPALAVPDARLLARVADTVLYAVAWNRTTVRQATAGLAVLEAAQLPEPVLVLSQADPAGLDRHGDNGSFRRFRASGYYES